MQNSVPLHVRLNNVQVPCYCCVTRNETCADCSLLEARFTCRNPLHLAKVRTGSFAVPAFLTFFNAIDFGRVDTIKHLPRAIPDLCTPLLPPPIAEIIKTFCKTFTTTFGLRLLFSVRGSHLTSEFLNHFCSNSHLFKHIRPYII